MRAGIRSTADQLVGERTQPLIVLAYVISALLAGLCGVLFILDDGSAQPSQLGNFYELWAIAAAVLGGCAVLSVTVFCGYALVFSTGPMIQVYRRARRWIEGVLAVFFTAAGVGLLVSRA